MRANTGGFMIEFDGLKRLDWALKHGAVMGRVMLTWFSGTGEPSTKITNAEHVRATIDELMQELGHG